MMYYLRIIYGITSIKILNFFPRGQNEVQLLTWILFFLVHIYYSKPSLSLMLMTIEEKNGQQKKKNEKKKYQRMWTLQAEPVVLFVLFCFFFFRTEAINIIFFFCLFKVRECLYAWETLKNSTVDGIIIIIIVIKKIK